MTLRGNRHRRRQTTLESYRLLLAALPHADDTETEMLRTVVAIAEDERALRTLTDLADDPGAPRRAGVTLVEFLRRRGLQLAPAVSVTVEETGCVHLSIRGERPYDITWEPDCCFVVSVHER